MKWKELYKKYANVENKEIGIHDWEQRGDILIKWIERYCDTSKYLKVLDIGCNIGIAGAILKEAFDVKIYGIDIDLKTLKINSMLKNERVSLQNAELLGIKNHTMDIVIALNLIEHLEKPHNLLNEIKRIIKPRGLAIFSLPNEIFFRKFLGLIPKDPTHKQSWSIFSFKKFLKQNELKIIDMKPVGRVPFLMVCQTFMVLTQVNKW